MRVLGMCCSPPERAMLGGGEGFHPPFPPTFTLLWESVQRAVDGSK